MNQRALSGGRPLGGFFAAEKGISDTAAEVLLGMRAAGSAVMVHTALATLQGTIMQQKPHLLDAAPLSADTVTRWLASVCNFSYRMGESIHSGKS